MVGIGDPLHEFRPDVPSPARMYDYYLGGKDHFPADRKAAERVITMMPPGVVRTAARNNRAFLGRAVRHLVADVGIRQFIDIGTGLPTMGNVHEVAKAAAEECRVVYVDYDPVVLAHGRDMLRGVDQTTIIKHDLRDPEKIIADENLRRLIDLDEPVAVLLVAILHFVRGDEDPRGIVRTLMDALPAGSHLVISHATADSHAELAEAVKVYRRATSRAVTRNRREVTALFDGFDLVTPGLVWASEWHPDVEARLRDDPGRSLSWAGVARKA